jgi:ribosomal protein L11 methylase PrmA
MNIMATIEVFQKVGEMTITELRPASMNRAIAQDEKNRQEEEERIRKEREEAEKQVKASAVLVKLIEAINHKAEQGGMCLSIDWNESNDSKQMVSSHDWLMLHSDYIDPILTGAGYKVSTHWYSDSWTRRSGKIGYVYIYWHQ